MLHYVTPALALMLLLIAFERSLADEVDVYLFGGQSNMQGVAKVENIPAELDRKIPNVFFFNGASFEPFVIGRTRSSVRASLFGPEVGFALEMSAKGRPIYLIKYSSSGMPLHHGWNGNRWEGGEAAEGRRNFHPGQSSSDSRQGTLYREMLSRFKKGLQLLQENGDEPSVRGFIWMQGEQDSKHEQSAIAYAANLKQLRDRIAEDLLIDDELPMAYGQVLPFEPAAARFTHRTQIREQMEFADCESGRPESVANAKMVSTDGFGLLRDTVHYDSSGQLRLGRAFANAILGLQKLAYPNTRHAPLVSLGFQLTETTHSRKQRKDTNLSFRYGQPQCRD